MGDAHGTSFRLPPGVRFYPSEEVLFSHYLAGKNAEPGGARAEGYDLIGELELYGYDPFELPDRACYAYGVGARKRHWFCFTGKAKRGGKRRRRAKSGFWRRKGKSTVVLGLGGDLGTRTKFVFYLGNSPKNAVKTDWVLYEYAPIDRLKGAFVLCRVFAKSRPRNSVSENCLVSCASESVSLVRHIGIQHDGDNISSRNNDTAVDGHVVIEPVPEENIQLPVITEPDPQMDLDALTAEHLLAILNDDYLELDDLDG